VSVGLYGEQEGALEGGVVNSIFRFSKEFARKLMTYWIRAQQR